MAHKPSPPSPPSALSPDQMQTGIDRIKRRVADLEAFDPQSVQERWAPETKALEVSIDETLSRVFGNGTSGYHRYRMAASLDRGGLVFGGGPDPLYKVHRWLTEGKADSLALLKQAVKGLEEDLADMGGQVGSSLAVQPAVSSNEIFVVHGRDDAAKIEVARFIERAGLKAIILHEQANAGATIIEKFERHGSAAGFAVVIATPDDVGGLTADDLKLRARQNVIGEMFWFAGRLGRDRVCALIKDDIEMPSDFAGVGYTKMDERGAWKSELLRELDAAGYHQLDWKKALV